ncbi:hypothetical protein F4819DRAFT_466676 [Hypoxylon fuscum]|nr:hypothetical protein F4819DRAFT_466676 [Hypoxylon fuscum]
MFILKQLQVIARASILFSRQDATSPNLPASCYDSCNNAYLEAQYTGKTTALCEPDSTFRTYVDACHSCSEETVNWDDATEDSWVSNMQQFLDFCKINFTSSTTVSPTIPYVVVSTTIPFTTTTGGVLTTLSSPTVITIYSAIPATAIFTETSMVNGQITTWYWSTTYQVLPKDMTKGIESNTTSVTGGTPPTSVSTELVQHPSRAWIAGPAVGGFAGLLVVGLGGLLLWRRRHKVYKTEAELHGETAIKSEMEVPNHPRELEAANPLVGYEGAARPNEPHELAGDEPSTNTSRSGNEVEAK